VAAAGSARPPRGSLLLAAAGGVALLAAMFLLPWFGASEVVERGFDEAREIQQQFGGPEVVIPDVSDNAWQAFGIADVLLALAAAIGVGLALAALAQRPPVSRLAAAGAITGLGVLATAVVLYHLVNPPGDQSREVGAFAGLAASGALALGGWMALNDAESVARRRSAPRAGVSPPDAPRGRARSATRRRSPSSSD
jgi:type II secretory pathway component PulM